MTDSENSVTNKDGVNEGPATASYGGAAIVLGGQIGPFKVLSILGEGGYHKRHGNSTDISM